MTLLIPVVGLLCTTLVLLLWYPKPTRTGKLADLYTVDSARTLSSLDQKTLDYKLLAAGLPIKPVTFRLLCVAAGIGGAVITWLFLPGLPAIVVGGIIFYVPNAWLDDRVKSRGRKIDQLLPIGIGRIAAGRSPGFCPIRCRCTPLAAGAQPQAHRHRGAHPPRRSVAVRQPAAQL